MKSLSVIKVYFYFRPNEVLSGQKCSIRQVRCFSPSRCVCCSFCSYLADEGPERGTHAMEFASKLTKTTLVMLKMCAKLWILIFFMICTGQDSHEGKQCCNTGRCCWHWQWTHLACPACLFCDCFALFRTLANIPSWSKKIEWSLSRTAVKSRQENKSLKAKMCAKRTGIQPSICRSRSHLVGWHLQAPEMFEDHGCRQFSRDKVYQFAADSNSSNFSCAKKINHIEYIPTM